MQRTASHIPGNSYVESEPKTKSGRRRIILPVVTIEALKAHRVYQDKRQVKWMKFSKVCEYR